MADDNTAVAAGFMRRRVVGVPVMYWLLGGVGVLAIVAYRMRTTSDNSADSEPDVPLGDQQNDTATGDPDADYSPFNTRASIVANPIDRVPVDQPEIEMTNALWLKKAVEWRVSKGQSGGTVQAALQAYLNGDRLTIEQGQERDLAIKEFGLPPDPPSTTSTDPTPVMAAPAKAQGPLPRYHTIINSNDDSYAKLASIYYPTSNADSVNTIERANIGKLSGVGPFRSGTRVYVPVYRVPVYYTSTKKTNTAAEIARKNGTNTAALYALNDRMKFPVKAGTRVRVA